MAHGPRSRREVDHRHAALAQAGLTADAREAAVRHVELGGVAARVEPVGAHTGLDEAGELERLPVDQMHTAGSQVGHVEDLAVGAHTNILRDALVGQRQVPEYLAARPVDLDQPARILAGHDQVAPVDRVVPVVDPAALGGGHRALQRHGLGGAKVQPLPGPATTTADLLSGAALCCTDRRLPRPCPACRSPIDGVSVPSVRPRCWSPTTWSGPTRAPCAVDCADLELVDHLERRGRSRRRRRLQVRHIDARRWLAMAGPACPQVPAVEAVGPRTAGAAPARRLAPETRPPAPPGTRASIIRVAATPRTPIKSRMSPL
jgi:hypothetical protein